VLTTSIAYGYFCYEDRIEFQRIKKNLIYGAAYVTAYLDSDDGNSKIQPGQCRIVKRNLPNEIKTAIGNHNSCILKMVGILQKDNEHYYYYWMLEDPSEIEEFERKYYDACNSKYLAILNTLKGNADTRRMASNNS